MAKRIFIILGCIALAVIILGGPIYKRWIRDLEKDEIEFD